MGLLSGTNAVTIYAGICSLQYISRVAVPPIQHMTLAIRTLSHRLNYSHTHLRLFANSSRSDLANIP